MITMTFILSCIFNLFLFQQRKKKASQQPKYNSIHLATLTIGEKTYGRPCEQKKKINIAALCCANVNCQLVVLRVE